MTEPGRHEFLTRWMGPFPGVVVSDDDPDRNTEGWGRLRVRVDALHGTVGDAELIGDAELPWARPSFPCSGAASGIFHVPPIGATVWVAAWGGSWENPVWLGGWFAPDDVPTEVRSAYDAGPKTRVVRTPNGHVFEMRFRKGEERITIKSAGGEVVELIDADALGGPKLRGSTPGGYGWALDEKAKRTSIFAPSGARLLLDDNAQQAEFDSGGGHKLTFKDSGAAKVTLHSTKDLQVDCAGDLTVTALGKADVTVTGDVNLVGSGQLLAQIASTAQLTLQATLALIITAACTIAAASYSLTATTIALIGTVTLGQAGPKFALINVLGLAKYNAHVHPVLVGVTGPVTTPMIPGTDSTVNTTAN